MTSLDIGVVLPETHWGDEEWRNAEAARGYVAEAADLGVEMVCFPEGYPGPATGPLEQPELDRAPLEFVREAAAEHGVWVAASDVEANPEQEGTYYLTLRLVSPDGEVVETYRRMQPDVPPLNAYLYNGKAHFLPGDDFVVADVPSARLGLVICSELWTPEIPRVNMLRGANVLFAPVHGMHSSTHLRNLHETWRHVARARAAENLCYVIVTQNVYQLQDFEFRDNISAGAFVAGPEEMVAVREEPGVMPVRLDMDRLDYLRHRNYDEQRLSSRLAVDEDVPRVGTRAGQIWERRPEVFGELAEPSEYAFDYDYAERGLDAWLEEYDRIYRDGEHERMRERYGLLQFKEPETAAEDPERERRVAED